MQTSLWSAFKVSSNWLPIRAILRRNGNIVGGAQVLVRQLPLGLKIARVPQGPVILNSDPELFITVIEYLVDLIRIHNINYMALQPDVNYSKVDELRDRGVEISQFLGDVRATLLLDLTQRSETLLRQMRRTTRNNIRQAEGLGIRVREGTLADMSIFSDLMERTARRQEFVARPLAYYISMWTSLNPAHHIKLFLAEYQGEPISSLLVIPFGDTVMVEAVGWSGPRSRLRPNELLLWKGIEWAKNEGYRQFDLAGIHISAAHALLSGKSLPEDLKSDATRFKLGFGGSIVMKPPTFEYIPNRALRLFLRKSSSIIGKRDLTSLLQEVLSKNRVSLKGFTSMFLGPRK